MSSPKCPPRQNGQPDQVSVQPPGTHEMSSYQPAHNSDYHNQSVENLSYEPTASSQVSGQSPESQQLPPSHHSYDHTDNIQNMPYPPTKNSQMSAQASQSRQMPPSLPSQYHYSHAANIKALIQQRIPANNGASVYQPFITSAQDFTNQAAQYATLKLPPAGFAEDYPASNIGQQQLAQRLTDAMTNIVDAEEDGKKSVARLLLVSPYEAVLKSWELLLMIRDVQLGLVAIPGWGTEWPQQKFDNFMDRFNSVCSALNKSKSISSSVFEEGFCVRLAFNPTGELRKKMANYKNTTRRAKTLSEVRQTKRKLEEMGQFPKSDAPEPKRFRMSSDEPGSPSENKCSSAAEAGAYATPSSGHGSVNHEQNYTNVTYSGEASIDSNRATHFCEDSVDDSFNSSHNNYKEDASVIKHGAASSDGSFHTNLDYLENHNPGGVSAAASASNATEGVHDDLNGIFDTKDFDFAFVPDFNFDPHPAFDPHFKPFAG